MAAITIADLNNAKEDVDHIAEVATSSATTATDRLGGSKLTLAGAVAAITAINPRGNWAGTTAYAVKDVVMQSGTAWICVVAHTSAASFATDQATKWRIYQGVLASELANNTTPGEGAGKIVLDTEVSGHPDRSLGQRIHRDYINVGDIGGTDPTGTVDNTAQVLAAVATGKRVRLDGFYRISAPIADALAGVFGDGARKSGLIVNGAHAFTFSNGALDRRRARFDDFAIDSLSNSCDSKFGFYAPGVASGAAPVYNSGLRIQGIEIGRFGRFGGFAYLKDFFRVSIYDIGGTDLSRGVQIVGSVVQTKIRGFTSNNDSAATTMSRYGLSTEAATYSTGVMTPENLLVNGFDFIRCERGLNHTAGLMAVIEGMDVEADAYGAVLNAPCTLSRSLFGPGTGASAWVGISRGVSISDPDDMTKIEDVDINCLRSPSTPGSSYGLDAGNGASPVYGLVVRDLRVRGNAGALQHAIRGRILNGDAEFQGVKVRPSVCLSTHISIQSGRDITVAGCNVGTGSIVVNDAGDTSSRGRVTDNIAASVTVSASNDSWTVVNPATGSGSTRALGEQRGTFTGTLTGCTASPTGTLRYVLQGRQVTLFIPAINGTSNTTSATITGMPSLLWPNRTQDMIGRGTDAGVNGITGYRVDSATGVISMFFGTALAGWAASGTKGTANCTLTYSLD